MTGRQRAAAGSAERRTVAIGVGSAVAGIALVAAPDRTNAVVGLADRRSARLIGVVDLALATGLVAGRPRWPWLAARAAANLAIAVLGLRSARGTGRARRAQIFAGALVAATLGDAWTLRALWSRS